MPYIREKRMPSVTLRPPSSGKLSYGVSIRELEGLGADVTWFQGPGAHSWQFWDQEIKKAVPWMLNAKKQEVDDETQRV